MKWLKYSSPNQVHRLKHITNSSKCNTSTFGTTCSDQYISLAQMQNSHPEKRTNEFEKHAFFADEFRSKPCSSWSRFARFVDNRPWNQDLSFLISQPAKTSMHMTKSKNKISPMESNSARSQQNKSGITSNLNPVELFDHFTTKTLIRKLKFKT